MKRSISVTASLMGLTGLLGMGLAGCSATTPEPTVTPDGGAAAVAVAAAEVWDSSALHSFAVEYDNADYDALIDAYLDSGEKIWIETTVTIDGETYENAGLKLKGNSSLRGLTAEQAEDPQDLPWIIRLDKFVDGQSHDGATEFAVRSNSAEASLNEAVALDLLDAAGLAAEEAISVSFTANGSVPALRLVVENPNDAWMERELGEGLLWKAESGGTWDYVGDDPADYTASFDQEGGDEDYAPLISFLQFVNESSDSEFASELPDYLDVDAFATYLAFQELVQNSDDIDGPGNNAYLYWDPDTEQMTVVNWDLNLAYGSSPGGGGGFGGGFDRADAGAGEGGQRPEGGWQGGERTPPEGMEMPEGMERPEGMELPDDFELPGDFELPDDFDPSQLPQPGQGGRDGGFGGGMGGMGGSNILAERFLANDDFNALYESELERLSALFYEDGAAEESLDSWVSLLTNEAGALIGAEVVETEATNLRSRFGTDE